MGVWSSLDLEWSTLLSILYCNHNIRICGLVMSAKKWHNILQICYRSTYICCSTPQTFVNVKQRRNFRQVDISNIHFKETALSAFAYPGFLFSFIFIFVSIQTNLCVSRLISWVNCLILLYSIYMTRIDH